MTSMTGTNILIFGSNFIASQIFGATLAYDKVHVTVMDRKDPLVIQNQNQTTRDIISRYCEGMTYRDFFKEKAFGDRKTGKKISFMFKDWVNEEIDLSNYDIIFHTGCIYDTLYADYNSRDTWNVATSGLHNVLTQLKLSEKRPLFVFISSINVYGDQLNNETDEELTEETDPNPQDNLNQSLLQQENYIKQNIGSYADYMILRLGTLIGEFTPVDSLVTATALALITKQETFTVYNGKNSIELLNMTDLSYLIANIVNRYITSRDMRETEREKEYTNVVNQIYNIKTDEKEEKTVLGVVRSFCALGSNLPSINEEHKIKKLKNYSIEVPKLLKSYEDDKHFIKFGRGVSSKKAYDRLGFISSNPLSYSYKDVVRYCLKHLIADMPDNEREAIEKIFYIPRTPTPERVERKKKLNKHVKDLVKQVNHKIEKGLNDKVEEDEFDVKVKRNDA